MSCENCLPNNKIKVGLDVLKKQFSFLEYNSGRQVKQYKQTRIGNC